MKLFYFPRNIELQTQQDFYRSEIPKVEQKIEEAENLPLLDARKKEHKMIVVGGFFPSPSTASATFFVGFDFLHEIVSHISPLVAQTFFCNIGERTNRRDYDKKRVNLFCLAVRRG